MLTKILEMGACLIEKGIHLESVTTAARETQIKEALELSSARLQNGGSLHRQKL